MKQMNRFFLLWFSIGIDTLFLGIFFCQIYFLLLVPKKVAFTLTKSFYLFYLLRTKWFGFLEHFHLIYFIARLFTAFACDKKHFCTYFFFSYSHVQHHFLSIRCSLRKAFIAQWHNWLSLKITKMWSKIEGFIYLAENILTMLLNTFNKESILKRD